MSRQFVKQTETALAELLARDLTGKDIEVLMRDGEHLADTCVIVALAITADGQRASCCSAGSCSAVETGRSRGGFP